MFLKQLLTMEQKFGKNSIDIEALREFCEREGKEDLTVRATNWSARATPHDGWDGEGD